MLQYYTLADPLFYDEATRWTRGAGHLADAEFGISSRPVPQDWISRRRTVWRELRPEGHRTPEQGWKIHISATLENADRLCTTVWDYCVERGIAFKYLMNRNMLLAFNAKYTPRGTSGKLIAIYPPEELFAAAVTELAELTKGEQGPYILSDLRIGDGPVYVRFGGFVRMRCVDENGEITMGVRRPDGVIVPDRRRPYFSPPDWVELPEVLLPHLEARKAASAQTAPYRVERALHFSNAGGVYVATRRPDGLRVVLKEARPHTAIDNNHLDAPARLREEAWALRKLAGVRGVPQLHDEFTMGGHHFLAQEFVEGEPLTVWIAVNHPWATMAEPTPGDLADYTRKAARVVDSLTALLEEIHARGVVFGDLHLGNVMVTPEGTAALVDFELAFDSARTTWRPGLGAMGFVGHGKQGAQLDRHALAAIMLSMFLPFSKIHVLQPDKVFHLVRVVTAGFPLPPGWAETIRRELAPPGAPAEPGLLESEPYSWRRVAGQVAEGILDCATPDRDDRLFPGDIQQFVSGGLSFGYGAAGVLWALDVTGHGRHPAHEQWLLQAIERMEFPYPGFYDGVAGLAYALDHLGYQGEAMKLLEHHPIPEQTGLSLASGLAGIAAARLHLGVRWDEPGHRTAAYAAAERLADALRAGGSPPAGLMRGWSGVGLFFTRLYEHSGDQRHLDLAVQAVHRDLDACVTNKHGALMVEETGVRLLPYLESGSAGIALVIDELSAHTGDERIREALPGLLRACSPRLAVQADLFRGKAGLILALARLAESTDLERHREVLAWHAIELGDHLAFPGNLGYRLSMDLATGSAGALLALAGDGPPALPFFSPRPRAGER
ncbi:class III lanthionine synthetase LanKC [Nonomuraea sp. SYSU D8015]|uniref:class III lanthionine synthetase LanKC n=1 Tax=Nonomuraea sp. SYSU D8015 TaxID=2593644 RepID=UPI001CB6EF2D|nr:class III lanthionine synthetase LanKC [Nonomuraea sp. SYSU D8015]